MRHFVLFLVIIVFSGCMLLVDYEKTPYQTSIDRLHDVKWITSTRMKHEATNIFGFDHGFYIYVGSKEDTLMTRMSIRSRRSHTVLYRKLTFRCGTDVPIVIEKRLSETWSWKHKARCGRNGCSFYETADLPVDTKVAEVLLSCKNNLLFQIAGPVNTFLKEYRPTAHAEFYRGLSDTLQLLKNAELRSSIQ